MIDTYNQQIQYDVSCTIRTNINTANHHFIVEECNTKENRLTPTKVSTGTQHKSSFEDNLGGISRTVKTDDSLAVMEDSNKDRCIQVGNIYPDSENMANRSGGRVNSTTGCAPTILSRDFKQPKMIMEEVKIEAMRGRNPDNPSERGKSNGNYQQRLEVNENGTSNTITSVQKDNLVIEPTEDTATTICLNSKVDDKQPSVADRIYDTNGIAVALTSGWKQNIAEVLQVGNLIDDTDRNFKNPQTGRVYSVQGLAPTINTCQGGNREPKIIDQSRYRIRKLTPRECFRLMGCDEETIDIIQAAGISNSQQYKLAGNSIMVACLEKIFEQMFFPQYTNSRTLFG